MTKRERELVSWLRRYCQSGLESAEDRAFLRTCEAAERMLQRWSEADDKRRGDKP